MASAERPFLYQARIADVLGNCGWGLRLSYEAQPNRNRPSSTKMWNKYATAHRSHHYTCASKQLREARRPKDSPDQTRDRVGFGRRNRIEIVFTHERGDRRQDGV